MQAGPEDRVASETIARLAKYARWAARSLSVLFALFLAVFALDVFNGDWREAAIAFAIHLVPTFLLLAATIAAWRWEWLGALVFAAFAVWYLWSVGLDRHWSWYAAICAPAAMVSLLYLTGFLLRRIPARSKPGQAD
jgi:hypothetical protein